MANCTNTAEWLCHLGTSEKFPLDLAICGTPVDDPMVYCPEWDTLRVKGVLLLVDYTRIIGVNKQGSSILLDPGALVGLAAVWRWRQNLAGGRA